MRCYERGSAYVAASVIGLWTLAVSAERREEIRCAFQIGIL